MIMGAVYLSYSAYFLSNDFSGVSGFMKVSMISSSLVRDDLSVPGHWRRERDKHPQVHHGARDLPGPEPQRRPQQQHHGRFN